MCGGDGEKHSNELIRAEEEADVEDEEVTTLVLDGIRADYKCLETYTSNNDVLNCPIVIIGGTEGMYSVFSLCIYRYVY